jgi:hypothetical protein
LVAVLTASEKFSIQTFRFQHTGWLAVTGISSEIKHKDQALITGFIASYVA